jgi:hypothetical protein
MDFSNQNYGPDSPNPQEKIKPAKPKRSKLKKEEPRFKQRMSKRSGGPRTPEGKAKSSQNSVAHGGYITPSRISEEFCRFEQEVFGRLEPVGPIEAEFVSQIASTLWRSKLMRRYIDNELDAIEFDDVSNRQLAVATEFPFEERYQFLLNVNEAENLRRQRFVKFWTTSCEKLSTKDCAEEVIVLADNRISEIYQETIQIMKQSFVHEWMHEKFFDSLDRVMLEANEGRNSLGIKLKELDDKTDLVNYWIYRNSLKISAARKRLREREAIRIMCDPNIARAQSTADYALIKQLQNYWLLKNSDMKTGRDLQPRIAKQTISHITLAP